MSSSKLVGFATCKDFPDGVKDDIMIAEKMKEMNIDMIPIDWQDDKQIENCDALIIRSTWNYQSFCPDFLKWIESVPIPLYNSASIMKWNYDKVYLKQIQEWEIETVPTVFLDFDFTASRETLVENALEAFETLGLNQDDEFVIKPSVSASAYGTYRLKVETDADKLLDVFNNCKWWQDVTTLLIQPCLQTFVSPGELSMLFFNNEYSHSVVKRPASGDFRVQQEYGGSTEFCLISEAAKEFGAKVLNTVCEKVNDGKPLLYARVDVVADPSSCENVTFKHIEEEEVGAREKIPERRWDQPTDWSVPEPRAAFPESVSYFLSEIELIEPSLYIMQNPASAQTAAEAIATLINN